MDFVLKEHEVMKLIDIIDYWFDSWLEWQCAKRWSKRYHPAWLKLAMQMKRPEIKTTYRKKVLEAYRTRT